METFRRYQALKNNQGVTDSVVVEMPVQLFVNNEALTVSMASPSDIQAWTFGLLLTEGLIASAQDVLSYQEDINPERISVHVTLPNNHSVKSNKRSLLSVSACGICGKTDFIPPAGKLTEQGLDLTAHFPSFMKTLNEYQALFKETGGCHGVALFAKDGNLITVMEDIGRHNAVDKAIGQALLCQTRGATLVVSGRISYEIVVKCFKGGVPHLVAVSAPTSLAIDYCKEFGISMWAFVRGEQFTQYA